MIMVFGVWLYIEFTLLNEIKAKNKQNKKNLRKQDDKSCVCTYGRATEEVLSVLTLECSLSI